jgi:UDP-2,3-diacylglucosamine pyrophosphatase LpxH
MPNHEGFLKLLLEEFPRQVYLVGKYEDAQLGLPEDDILRVFIPDLHWLSKNAKDRYPEDYGFTGNKSLPDGRPLFGTFLDVLENVRDEDTRSENGRLEVYQLGDAFDLWREKTPAENDATNAYRRIRQDPIIGNLADRLDTLSVHFVSGNHDHWLTKVVNSDQMARRIKKEWTAAREKIRLTHGHEYSALEMGLPDDIQAAAVHFVTRLKQSEHDIGVFSKASMSRIEMIFKLRERPGFRKDFFPRVKPDGACLIEKISDIQDIESRYRTYLDISRFSKTPGNANDFDHVSYIQFADQIIASELSHVNDHSVHVIGHTHGARLLVDKIPPDRPYVTLDCGGWLGLCNVLLKGKKEAVMVPSAQFGVQCGNDIRVYQLGGAE